MLWIGGDAEKHALLRGLGVEPFDPAFTGAHLHALARGRRVAVKQFIMNASVVTGVGNIYASEALFRAGIHPARAVGRISLERWNVLARGDPRHALPRARCGGLDPSRLRLRFRRAGPVPERDVGVRPGRPALPPLLAADQGGAPGAALHVLLRGLPAMSVTGNLVHRHQGLREQPDRAEGMARVDGRRASRPSAAGRRSRS
jgi:hypothetical protein